jgi:hypothetical protein
VASITALATFGHSDNWLQVLGTIEPAQIDQRVRHQFHAIVPLRHWFSVMGPFSPLAIIPYAI